jgi:hypothetical protein
VGVSAGDAGWREYECRGAVDYSEGDGVRNGGRERAG